LRIEPRTDAEATACDRIDNLFRLPRLQHLKNGFRPWSMLEVGIYKGETGRWFLDNVLTHADSMYVGIDDTERPGVYDRLDDPRATVIIDDSNRALRKMTFDQFDIILIDGDHTALGTLTDTVLAWSLLKQGGFMIWDDYMWYFGTGVNRDQQITEVGHLEHIPKMAIDAFLNCIHGHSIAFIDHGMVVARKGPFDGN
jgi:hypothetical protein